MPPPDDNSLRTTGGNWRWEPPAPAEVQRMLPQYEVEKLIGRGGMGAVYRGIQLSLERPVAIKLLPPVIEKQDPAFAERFKNEAKLMGRLNHPAIVSVYDFGRTNEGQLYFVMEYIDGTDVQQMIAAHGKLPADHALAITAHVCDALGYAHKQGVIHRDIKPSNILIDSDGRVKVADFGLAKVAGDDGHSRGLTQTGMTMGTPDYVAPESLILGIQVDGRADLYAVGVMLYQMLTGDLPRGMFKMPSQKVPGVDPRFDRIVRRALEQDREERYQSSGEIRRDLDVILTTPLVESGKQSSSAIPRQVAQEVPGRGKVPAHLQRQPRAPVHHDEVFEELPRRSSSLPYVIAVAVIVLGGGWAVLHQPAGTETPVEEPKTATTTAPVTKPEPPKPTPPPVTKPVEKPVAVVTPPTAPPSMPVTTPIPAPKPAPLIPTPPPSTPSLPVATINKSLPMAKQLDLLEENFQDTFDSKINAAYATNIKTLGERYLARLERDINNALQARRAAEAAALQEEQKRFTTHEFMPSIDPPGLAKVIIELREVYRDTEKKLTQQRDADSLPEYDNYLRYLAILENEALVQRRTEDASKIRVKRDDVMARRKQRAARISSR
ncbi:MAG: serine/threonine protein kinase [Verrucomicrobiaceae bacterium]|nr:serine/threonine protein kinase [Verrucomicrobiaceae bacterium]